MANENDGEVHTLPDPNHVPVAFVNDVANIGTVNGVINITFMTYQFTASSDLRSVETDPIVGARLRLDLWAAARLRDMLDEQIKKNTRPAVPGAASPAAVSEKVN